jgi:Ser/Thr protein kinase RdoA (MazF antagonist)
LPSHDAASLVTEASPHNPGPLEPWFPGADLAVIHEVVREAKAAFASFAGNQGEVGAVHNDFILGNCLWQGNDLRVLDFADCGVGLYLYDLAPMLTNLSGEPSLREQFIEGYASLRPLSSEHRAVLPLMEAVRHVSSCLWLVGKTKRGDVVPPLERHLEARMAEIRELMSV